VKGNREEAREELAFNIAPTSSVLQIYKVVGCASLNGVRGATALGTADAGVGS
jgi:hypothetical protein